MLVTPRCLLAAPTPVMNLARVELPHSDNMGGETQITPLALGNGHAGARWKASALMEKQPDVPLLENAPGQRLEPPFQSARPQPRHKVSPRLLECFD